MAMNLRVIALFSGVGFITLASFTQGVLPMLEPQTTTKRVTRVVRTDLGELKWTEADAVQYTDAEQHGRDLYIREGCVYCHSQYIRPVAGEDKRWGPVTQAGEYAYDTPHLFSTRRIGPDLSRVGLKYSDEWHYAHFWDPRTLVPDSIMPRFKKLFDELDYRVAVVDDDEGNRTLEKTPETEKIFDFSKADAPDFHIKITPSPDGLLFVPEIGKYPIIWTPNDEFIGDDVELAVVTDELKSMVAYLQKLGTNRGKWRDLFESQAVAYSQVTMDRSEDYIEFGKEVYERRCASCHGVEGDGNGPSATFMYNNRPRNFTQAVYKFRSTSSDSLPTDGDLLRTLTRGVRGTSMPSWHMLSEKARLSVIQYIKYELSVDKTDPDDPYSVFEEEEPAAPLHIARPPDPSVELIELGKEIWVEAGCLECHGAGGAGDGTKSAGLEDDNLFPISPANLTAGQFKSGPLVSDIYRTISNGFSGTPMPSYSDSFDEEERWALSYYVLSLSSYTDPLTAQALEIDSVDREALNDPTLAASRSRDAYRRQSITTGERAITGGDAWARRRGMEMVDEAPLTDSDATNRE